MTADLPTHPSTEAVGEVRRREVPSVDLDAVQRRVHRTWEWLRGAARKLNDADQLPLWVREHFARDVPALIKATTQLRSDLSAMTSDRDWLREEFEKQLAVSARLLEQADKARRLIGDLVRADNNHCGHGPGGRINAADTLPLQQLFGISFTLRYAFEGIEPPKED